MAAHSSDELSEKSHTMTTIAIAFLTVTWFFVLLRLYVRVLLIRNFGWDDTTIIIATLVFTVFCIGQLIIQANGGGTHVSPLAITPTLINWTIATEALYSMVMIFLKISLAILLNRIVVKPWQKRLILCVALSTTVIGLLAFFFTIFRCGWPKDYLIRQLQRKCTPLQADLGILYLSASVSTLTDWIFALLPIAVVWHANMAWRTKFSVCLVISFAAAGSICSIIRFQYLEGLTQFDDFFWDATNVTIWSTIEPGAGIIAGCMATLRPLFKRILHSTQSLTISMTGSRSTQQKSSFCRSMPSSCTQKTRSRQRSLINSVSVSNPTGEEDIELGIKTKRPTESTDQIWVGSSTSKREYEELWSTNEESPDLTLCQMNH